MSLLHPCPHPSSRSFKLHPEILLGPDFDLRDLSRELESAREEAGFPLLLQLGKGGNYTQSLITQGPLPRAFHQPPEHRSFPEQGGQGPGRELQALPAPQSGFLCCCVFFGGGGCPAKSWPVGSPSLGTYLCSLLPCPPGSLWKLHMQRVTADDRAVCPEGGFPL